MTTPRPTRFPITTPRAGVFAPLVIISDSDDEITTLPVRPAPPSPNYTPALYGYLLDSSDDSSDENLSETAKSTPRLLRHQLFIHQLPNPYILALPIARRPGKEISMPLGYRAAMDRWRTASQSTCHLLLPSEIPSLSSPPSLLPSSSPPSPSLLPSSSGKRSRLPSPSPPLTAVPPPPEHIESVRNAIETMRASLASAMQEMMTPRARVGSLEQHDMVTRESLRITRGRLTRSQLRAEYAEQEVRESREF
ncbi:hypothetical protein Tco_1030909 [Tanacetum coccineum]|uniref:Uncharacterized protein n=1 Tax=Tanacetum coccineum TaxID=301880 RepID=A0ABQ5G7J2_9ASTR